MYIYWTMEAHLEIKFCAYEPETLRFTCSLPVLSLNLPDMRCQMFKAPSQEVKQMFHWHCVKWRCRLTLAVYTKITLQPKIEVKLRTDDFSIFTSSGLFIKFKISATSGFFCFPLILHSIWSENLLTQFGPPLLWNQFQQHIKVCCSASNGQRLTSSSPRRPSVRLAIDV